MNPLKWTRELIKKISIFSAATILFVLVFFFAYPVLGSAVSYFILFPILAITWEFGLTIGIISGLFLVLIDILLRFLIPSPTIEQNIWQGLGSGMVALIGASIAAAWVHWMRNLGQAALDKHGKIEAALRESEQKYRSLFETMVEGISIDQVIFDSHGQVVDWIVVDVNPAYERILQISRDEAAGQRASQIYPPRGIPLLLAEFNEALKTGKSVNAQLRLDQRKLDVTVTAIASGRMTVILADVTERDRSMEAEREQRRLAEALRDISGALASTLELEEVLDRILVHLRKIADYDAVNMMLIDQGRVRIVRYYGYRERGLEAYIRGFSMPVEEVHGLRWMAEHRKPLVISNTQKDGSWMVFPPTAWIQSYVGIPIFSRDELIGFLNLNSATPDFFQAAQIDRLQPFANQAALAIANARVFEDTQKRAQRLALINRVASTLNQPLELKTVLQVTADCLAEALNVPQVAVALFDETRKHLPIVADHPAPGNRSLVGTDLPVEGNPSMDYILREKTSLLIEDAQQDDQLVALRSIMVQRGISSIVIIPLIIRGEVAGTIGCDLIEAGRRYTAEEIELAETITNMAAVRIEQARLFAEEHRRSSELALLHITSLDITMTNDLPKLLQTVVERAAWLMDAQGGSLYLTNHEEKVLERRVGFNLHYDIPDERMNFGQGAAGQVAVTGRPLIVPNYKEWPERSWSEKVIFLPFSVLSVPVLWQGQVTGVLQLIREDPRNPFTQKEVDLLGLFSNQVAVSLENARLYNEVQQIAIQDTLTGLYNRRGFTDVAQREIERSRRFQRPLAALMVDIDRFKLVNDTYGHLVGDQVLGWLADLCRVHLRSIDIIGRYGGEEFIILLVENDLETAARVATRLCGLVDEAQVLTSAGPVHITVSIGVARLSNQMTELHHLINAADEALYVAKRSGRNQARVFQSPVELRPSGSL